MKTYFKSILLYTMLLLSALSVKAKSTSERMSNMEVLSWNNCLTLPSFNSMPNKGIAGAFFGASVVVAIDNVTVTYSYLRFRTVP